MGIDNKSNDVYGIAMFAGSSLMLLMRSAPISNNCRMAGPARAFLCLLIGLMMTSPASAGCQEDIEGYMKRRDGVFQQLNAMTGGKKKQLDPAAACPKFRSLTSILTETIGYLEKNREWCGLSPDMISGAKKQRAQFADYSSKACGAAAKMKQMQREAERRQAEGGVMGGEQKQRLPTGPL